MSETTSLSRILVTVAGPDQVGITAKLTQAIADGGAHLLDIEQVVLQGQLTLVLVLGLPNEGAGERVLKDLLFGAKRMGLDLSFQPLDVGWHEVVAAEPNRYAVTAIGDRLDAREVAELARILAENGANIDSIRRLSEDGLSSVEAIVVLPDAGEGAKNLRRRLMDAMHALDVDVAVQRERLTRRTKRLVVMDMDSTLIQIECIDELARMHGVVDQVSSITARAMAGELDFSQSLKARVGLLEGMPWEQVVSLADRLPVTEGARDMLKVLRTLGYKTAVISGGFTFAANKLKADLGLDYAFSNELEVKDGKLTGRVIDPIVHAQRKADLLEEIAKREGIAIDQTIAIGDGANDLPMLERAGLGIAFHAKPKLKAAADTSVSRGGLDRMLYLLGLHARDVREVLGR
ncbi:MAG: phosphoserine phosphatase SerB [Polyangiales bacterium]